MTVKQRAATGEQVFQVMLDNRPQLIQTARRVLRDDMEAEDIVQEVAAAILSAPHLLEASRNAAVGWPLWFIAAVSISCANSTVSVAR
jgi:DNA-directed RNA polymerase specialized sigma24 family protein